MLVFRKVRWVGKIRVSTINSLGPHGWFRVGGHGCCQGLGSLLQLKRLAAGSGEKKNEN